MTVEDEVRGAMATLVAAFGRTDTEAYFRCFAPEATFLFHTTPGLLRTRAEYEAVWRGWLAEGLQVHACESSDQHVTTISEDVAVFTHRVRTDLTVGGDRTTLHERETIVVTRRDGRWSAVHEHLSPDPAGPWQPGPQDGAGSPQAE